MGMIWIHLVEDKEKVADFFEHGNDGTCFGVTA
jgi:hypothetical protein